MIETGWRSVVVSKLKKFGHCIPVENPADPGTPDVFFLLKGAPICAWVELKYLQVFPVYDKEVLHVPKYRPQQRNWIRKHYRNGGRAFLFVRIENEYFLFHPQVAIENVNINLSTQDFSKKALRHWKGKIDYEDLVKVITHHGTSGNKKPKRNHKSRKLRTA